MCMFERVLIVEDHELMNLSLRRTLQELNMRQPDHAYYSDQALSIIRRKLADGVPFELLITDLYFEKDGSSLQYPDGAVLIKAARELQPEIKILVFSAEGREPVIRPLFDDLGIDGYVRKARGDAKALNTAINNLYQNKKHYPPELRTSPPSDLNSITEFDKIILRLILKGYSQNRIPDYLAANGISPCSLSSVEKRLYQMRNAMNCANNQQLVAFCLEWQVI